jgi:hypothetical protein
MNGHQLTANQRQSLQNYANQLQQQIRQAAAQGNPAQNINNPTNNVNRIPNQTNGVNRVQQQQRAQSQQSTGHQQRVVNGSAAATSQQRPNNGQNPVQQNRPRPANPGVATGAATTNGQANAGAAPAAPPPPPVLPKGWKREEILRQRGITAGLVDVVYAPGQNAELCTKDTIGRKFRSKLELQKYFGSRFDTSLLDYRSGKLSQSTWRKQRRMKSIQQNPNSFNTASKYDVYLNLPQRQTANVFKQTVHYVTNNHKNEPTPSYVLNPSTLMNKNNQAALADQQINLTQNQLLAIGKNLDRTKPTQVKYWKKLRKYFY